MTTAWLNQKRRWAGRDRLNPEPHRRDLWPEYGRFLTTRAWDWFGTFTFAVWIHPDQAARRYDRWARQLQKANGGEMEHARAMEWQKRGVVHFHALISNVSKDIARAAWMTEWEDIGQGFARIYDYNPDQGAAYYLGKYVTKGGEMDLLRYGPPPPRAKRTRTGRAAPYWEQCVLDPLTPGDLLPDNVRRARFFSAVRKLTTHVRNCRPCGDACTDGTPAARDCTPGQALARWCVKYAPLPDDVTA